MLFTTEDNNVCIAALIQDNLWCKLCDMAVELDLMKLMVHKIINNNKWISESVIMFGLKEIK